MDTITCKICLQEKPSHAFHVAARVQSGHRVICKTCVNLKKSALRIIAKAPPLPFPLPSHAPALTLACTKCGEETPLDGFYVETRGRQPSPAQPCKVCRRAASRRYEHRQRTTNLAVFARKKDMRRRRYYALHREYLLAIGAAWRANNPERTAELARAWAQAHPDQTRAKTLRHRARRRSLPATFTPAERTAMLQYWGFACAVCGRQEGFAWTLADDHWIPLTSSQCPGTVARNIVPLCQGKGGCNQSKGNKAPHTWLLDRFGTRKAAKIERAIAAYFAVVTARVAS